MEATGAIIQITQTHHSADWGAVGANASPVAGASTTGVVAAVAAGGGTSCWPNAESEPDNTTKTNIINGSTVSSRSGFNGESPSTPVI